RQGGGKYFSIQSDKDIGNAFDDIFPDAGETDIGGPEKENLPYIKIKNITEMRRDGRIKQCRITYEFMDIPGRKDHSAFLKIRLSEIVTKTIVPEFRSKSPEGIAKTTAVHHTGNMGEGGIDVELPVDFTFEANVELWDISGVPDAIAISKSVSF
ncbi:MAG: hypothetical protein K8R21_14655, partial [Leptospira sp.]|nr:hypothetical protein [Leptospira sp.]